MLGGLRAFWDEKFWSTVELQPAMAEEVKQLSVLINFSRHQLAAQGVATVGHVSFFLHCASLLRLAAFLVTDAIAVACLQLASATIAFERGVLLLRPDEIQRSLEAVDAAGSCAAGLETYPGGCWPEHAISTVCGMVPIAFRSMHPSRSLQARACHCMGFCARVTESLPPLSLTAFCSVPACPCCINPPS
eukprot:9920832-Lingulodinium_polyedra.AAC.1